MAVCNNLNIGKFGQALENKLAVNFVKHAFIEHYQSFFKGHEEEVKQIVVNIFKECKEKGAEETIGELIGDNSWFKSAYFLYKRNIRPTFEYSQIKPYIKGNKLLDYGCGTGALSLKLKENNYVVSTCDILDYRFDEAKSIPFNHMSTTHVTNFEPGQFDTVIVKAVLHHIKHSEQPKILDELKRLGNYLIIEESVYGLDSKDPQVQELISTQELLRAFLTMTIKEQQASLVLIDFMANIFALGQIDMNMECEYKSPKEWQRMLRKHNIRLDRFVPLGFENERVTPDSRALLICSCYT